MMASKVTPATEKEGAEVEEAEEEGAIGAIGSPVSTRGSFNQSWVSLRRIEPVLIAPMVVKKGKEGIGMEKCQRIHVITEGKMSLSWVVVS